MKSGASVPRHRAVESSKFGVTLCNVEHHVARLAAVAQCRTAAKTSARRGMEFCAPIRATAIEAAT